MNKIVAFLGTSIRSSQVDVKQNWHVMSTRGDTDGEVIYNGETVPFKIITKADHLRGLRLIDYEVLDHARMSVDFELIEIAVSRIR